MKNSNPPQFPDFRNWGVIFRVLFLSIISRSILELLRFFTPDTIVGGGFLFYEPSVLFFLLFLSLFSPLFSFLDYFVCCLLAVSIAVSAAVLANMGIAFYLPGSASSYNEVVAVSFVFSTSLLFYFNWRHYRLSPAWAEARLMALQARIQPHFLFNSLNSVLSLIRVEPQKAETMLQDLCDLYRHLLTDVRQLVPLSQELELARTYLQIEGIRFGSRLRVDWQCQDAPVHALVPPLLLQPLLENAVHYGVEQRAEGAQISVTVCVNADLLDIRVSNPAADGPIAGTKPQGNHMALDNLRERLELHYDAEASLTSECHDGQYQVRVRLPVR